MSTELEKTAFLKEDKNWVRFEILLFHIYNTYDALPKIMYAQSATNRIHRTKYFVTQILCAPTALNYFSTQKKRHGALVFYCTNPQPSKHRLIMRNFKNYCCLKYSSPLYWGGNFQDLQFLSEIMDSIEP